MRIAINKDLQCKCVSVGCIGFIKMLSPARDLPCNSDECQHFSCVLQPGVLLSQNIEGLLLNIGNQILYSSFCPAFSCLEVCLSTCIALAFISSI